MKLKMLNHFYFLTTDNMAIQKGTKAAIGVRFCSIHGSFCVCRWPNQICFRHITMDLPKRITCTIIGYVVMLIFFMFCAPDYFDYVR